MSNSKRSENVADVLSSLRQLHKHANDAIEKVVQNELDSPELHNAVNGIRDSFKGLVRNLDEAGMADLLKSVDETPE